MRIAENVGYHKELVALSDTLGLRCATAKNFVSALSLPPDIAVVFLLSVPSSLKATLLQAASLLVYTPKFEHFGIVPLEAMLAERPVLAAKTGGPTETVVEEVTGWLRDADKPDEWKEVMHRVLKRLSREDLQRIGRQGRDRVRGKFSRETMALQLESEIVSGESKRAISTSRGKMWLMAGSGIIAAGIALLAQNLLRSQ